MHKMDLKPGDKIYKIFKGVVDKSKVFEIESTTQENDGNWHDGYITSWTASLVGEERLYMTAFKMWGTSYSEIYAEKVETDLKELE
jgi:hypothetical protein